VRTENDTAGKKTAIVSEVKWKHLSEGEERLLKKNIEAKWKESVLSRKYKKVAFEILDARMLAILAARE